MCRWGIPNSVASLKGKERWLERIKGWMMTCEKVDRSWDCGGGGWSGQRTVTARGCCWMWGRGTLCEISLNRRLVMMVLRISYCSHWRYSKWMPERLPIMDSWHIRRHIQTQPFKQSTASLYSNLQSLSVSSVRSLRQGSPSAHVTR